MHRYRLGRFKAIGYFTNSMTRSRRGHKTRGVRTFIQRVHDYIDYELAMEPEHLLEAFNKGLSLLSWSGGQKGGFHDTD
jgi:hypothetical protein